MHSVDQHCECLILLCKYVWSFAIKSDSVVLCVAYCVEFCVYYFPARGSTFFVFFFFIIDRKVSLRPKKSVSKSPIDLLCSYVNFKDVP